MAHVVAPFPGLYPACVTPYTPAGHVDYDVIDAYVDLLIADGCAGAFVCGTSGESMSLSVAERKEIANRFVKASQSKSKDFKCIIHVGANSIADIKELAAHAASINAAGISIMAPCFFKPTLDGLVAFVAEGAAAAPSTPLVYYHFPSITNVTFPLSHVLKALARQVPTLVAAKCTAFDTWDMVNSMCIPLPASNALPYRDGVPRVGCVQIMHGFEPQFSSSLSYKGCGWIGVTFSVIAPLYTAMVVANARGDSNRVMELQSKVVRFFNLIDDVSGSKGGIDVTALAIVHKFILAKRLKHKDAVLGGVRLPLLSHIDLKVLDKALTEYGFDQDGVLSLA